MIKAIIFDCYGVLATGKRLPMMGPAADTTDRPLFAYIEQELKPHYKLGLLSNVGANVLPDILFAEQIALFDGIALSYEIGAAKPDREAYETIAYRLDVEPAECVFIDDTAAYAAAASAAGMHGIHYQGIATLQAELNALLAV
jgi:FMN phosphatase YigB (HAD superfamily)